MINTFENIQDWLDANKPINSFICGDCMDGMKHFDNKYFDLAIIDPPYNIKPSNKSNYKKYDLKEPLKEYYPLLMKVSKNQIICGVNHLKKIHLIGGRIIWNKLGKDIGRRKQASIFSDAEIFYQSFNNLIKIYSYPYLGNVTGYNYEINSKEFKNRIHLSQKPIALYRWILQNYAKPGNIILDTHVGSASSLIACIMEDFKFIGFEIDKDFFKSAVKRTKDEIKQIRLI